MTVELGLYISAAAEMDAECELLGQLLADLPRSARWTIKRTPSADELANPALDLLSTATAYVILLGADLVAPMGVEWVAAEAAGLPRFCYRRRDRVPSPAAASFARESGATWQPYATPGEFVAHFEQALILELVRGTPGHGLDLRAIEELAEHLREIEQKDRPESEARRGAGQGGVILPSA
jgi:hypothetical protein